MSGNDFIDVDIPKAVLELDLESMTPQQQFDSWMLIKNAGTAQKILASNIVGNVLDRYAKQAPYERCFSRDTFDKGGGYDKNAFDKWCA